MFLEYLQIKYLAARTRSGIKPHYTLVIDWKNC